MSRNGLRVLRSMLPMLIASSASQTCREDASLGCHISGDLDEMLAVWVKVVGGLTRQRKLPRMRYSICDKSG